MTEERLRTSLALMHIHCDKEINLDDVVDIFSKHHPRKLQLSSILYLSCVYLLHFLFTSHISSLLHSFLLELCINVHVNNNSIPLSGRIKGNNRTV